MQRMYVLYGFKDKIRRCQMPSNQMVNIVDISVYN